MNSNKSLRAMIISGFAVLLLSACGALPSAPRTPQIKDTVEPLGVLPDNYEKGSIEISDSGEKYAFVIQTAAGQQVVENGKEGKVFLKISSLSFSPGTNRLFYWGLEESAGKQQIVLVADGTEIPTEYAGQGSLLFSKDGKRWAVIGGMPAKQDGTNLVPGPVVILSDGIEIGRYRDASYPAFSPDGKHLAYLIKDDASKISLVVDGQVRKTYEAPQVRVSDALVTAVTGPNLPPLFSVDYLSDGSLLILTQDRNGWTVYKDDTPLASYLQNVWGGGSRRLIVFEEFKTSASILASSVNVAEASPVGVWWERLQGDQDQWHVVRNGKAVDNVLCTSFWDAQRPAVSADGLRAGYPCIIKSTAQDKDEIFAVVDGTKYGPYEHVWGITFSKDGKHFAYAASDGSKEQAWSFYVDGKAYPLKYDTVWPPRLSADGAHVAWSAKKGDQIKLAIDGQEVGSGDELLWGPRFDQFGNVTWIVQEGNKIIRIRRDLI